jgi:UPF0271 protein
MRQLSLNLDLGELPDEPEVLYTLATVANIACGGHAGDEESMRRSLSLAQHHGVRVYAHPSYPDRQGFGRRSMVMTAPHVAHAVEEQCRALRRAAGDIAVAGMKPHGALYHDVTRDPVLAAAVLDAALAALGPVAVVGPPQGAMRQLCTQRGVPYVVEAFADRAYASDGTLVPRGQAGALLVDPGACAAQALNLARAGLHDTLCVHGDGPHAVAVATSVHNALRGAGYLLELA